MNITVKQIECATKKQLDEFAKQLGIKGYSRIAKTDLEAKLIALVETPQIKPVEE